MASTKMFATTAVIYLLSLFQKIDTTQLSNREVSSLLSLLNRNVVSNRKPVIIILENDSGKENKPSLMTSSDEHDAISIPHLLHPKSVKERGFKISTPSYLNLLQQQGQRDRLRHRAERVKIDDDSGLREDKIVQRSPIVKKLLRISNSLRCDAKDDCQDKCSNKYRGKKVVSCQVQCEVKYECDEPAEEEKDPCESGCEDSCGDNDCDNVMSTKGEKLVPEEVKCKRC